MVAASSRFIYFLNILNWVKFIFYYKRLLLERFDALSQFQTKAHLLPALIVNCWKLWSGAQARYTKTGFRVLHFYSRHYGIWVIKLRTDEWIHFCNQSLWNEWKWNIFGVLKYLGVLSLKRGLYRGGCKTLFLSWKAKKHRLYFVSWQNT